MKLFLKLALSSIKRHKSRYLILVLTITLSTIILLSTVFIKDSAITIREDQLRNSTLNSQLLLVKNNETNPYFNENEFDDLLNEVEGIKYSVPRIGGMVKNSLNEKEVSIIGADLEKQDEAFPFELVEGKIENSEDEIIISEKYARNNSLKVGSKIKLSGLGGEREFTVTAISKDTGIFMSNSNIVVINIVQARQLLDKPRLIYSIGLTIEDLDNINNIQADISKKISSEYLVQQRYDMDFFKSYVGTIEISLKVISVLSIFITILLMNSTFSLTIYENMHETGTLRSIGISKRDISKKILIENLTLVLTSMVLGNLLQIPFIKAVLNYLVQDTYIKHIDYSKVALINVFILLLSIVIIISSLNRIFKLSIVDILKKVDIKRVNIKKKNVIKHIFGLIALITSMIVLIIDNNNSSGVSILAIGAIFFLFSFICLIDILINILNVLLKNIFYILRSKAYFLFKEFTSEISNILNIVIIISIIISSLYISFNIKSMVINGVSSVYRSSDLMITVNLSVTENLKEKITDIDNVNKVCVEQRKSESLKDINVYITGINPIEYRNGFSTEIIKEGNEDIYSELSKGKNVIISNTFSKNTDTKVGDTLKIRNKDYTVNGIVSTFENMGKVIFISTENFEEDIENKDESIYFISINDISEIEETNKQIDNLLKDDYKNNYSIQQMDKLNESNNKSNEMIFNIVNVLIGISACICIISMNNNIAINILSRKKTYAIKLALGISRGSIFRFNILEASIIGIYSGIFGVAVGGVLNIFVNKILSYYIGDMVIEDSYALIVLLIILSIMISIFSYLYSTLKICKMNIIDEIKLDE